MSDGWRRLDKVRQTRSLQLYMSDRRCTDLRSSTFKSGSNFLSSINSLASQTSCKRLSHIRPKMTLPLGAIQVTVVSFITVPPAIVATFLRIWSRRLQNLPLGFHDYMAIVAMVLAAATVSVFLAGKLLCLGICSSKQGSNLGNQLDLLRAWECISRILWRLILLCLHFI